MSVAGPLLGGGAGIVIPVDGPAGSGKSTAAQKISEHLQWDYLETGALYRAVGLRVLGAGGNTGDLVEILPHLDDFRFECRKVEEGWRNFLDEWDVTQGLREERVSFAASKVSSFSEVRAVLLAYQRSYGIERGAVLDGRDIGTVVFPDAKLKFFFDADIEVRIQRRFDELGRNGISFDPVRLGADLRERDRRDRDREAAPLRSAEDAVLIDTSDLPIDRVLAVMLEKVRQVYGEEEAIEVR